MKQIIENIQIANTKRSIGSEKALKHCEKQNDGVQIELQFSYPAQHLYDDLHAKIQAALNCHVQLKIQSKIIAHKVQAGVKTISGVKNIIAVASGKGGVGKSTTTANLATAMAAMGARVGVLDADLYGPSQPTMLGVASKKPEQRNGKFIPVCNENGIQVMSIGLLVDATQAVVWRGPMISQALQQLLFQSEWDDVDYLFIDLPPGTGDIQLTLSQKIPVTGAIVVTTPQDIALLDARKAIDMFAKVNIPILGVLENMSVHICQNCGHQEALFGIDGGKNLAEQLNVPLLGQLPLSLTLRMAMDQGNSDILHQKQSGIAHIYRDAAFQIASLIANLTKDYSRSFPEIVVE